MSGSELTYIRAVNEALAWVLEHRPEAVVFGEDVALPNGPFGATKGLHARFGRRVFDTPISESAMVGMALGAAVSGRRPVVEVMYGDFLLVAMDQIVNQVCNARYVSRGALVPRLTIRAQQGATPGSCAQHSQSLEALFTHLPGLRVGAPSNPGDAFHMLRAAVLSDDPVLLLEARRLYPEKGTVDLDAPPEAVGGSRLVQRGDDLTVITWGTAARDVLAACELLAEQDISADVIDLRWLAPLDLSHALASAARTRRLAVVHEANRTGGFGAEVLARLAEQGVLSELARPPVRLAAADCRVPASPALSRAVLPTPERIAADLASLASSGGAGRHDLAVTTR
jgi:pyruvate/2-oxoglutarate/acetoin dehydrogenase E1 component